MLSNTDKIGGGRRLQLKKKPESSRTNQEEEGRPPPKRSKSPNTDDSLADFKSPKASPIIPPRIFTNVKRTGSGKPGPRCSKKKASGSATDNSRSKKASIENQPLIESAFFRAQSASASFVCPLCLKTFSDANTQTSHSKSCAAKNNVSTRKLLAAAELQKRQAAERLKLGLPAGPLQTPKKKSTNIKKLMPEGDPDIQLAMALSMSLKEIEQLEEFDEAVALVAESDEKFLEMSNTQRRSTLQSFGFKTNKPIVEAPTKTRRKRLTGPTVLQTRTQETRDRILTERIAEIIVDIGESTQSRMAQENLRDRITKKSKIRSGLLRKWHNSGQKLWNRSIATLGDSEYYVKELAPFISPIVPKEKQQNNENEEDSDPVELPVEQDNQKSEENVETDAKIDSKLETEVAMEESRSKEVETDPSDHKDDYEEKKSGASLFEAAENKSLRKCEEIQEPSEAEYEAEDSGSSSGSNNTTESDKKYLRKDDIDVDQAISLAFDWSKMVDNNNGADIEIVVRNDRTIKAHSVVLWARCPSLLNDCELNAEDRKKICWPDIDHIVASWALQFLYCGQVQTCCFPKHETKTDQLKSLGKNYQCEELFEYVKKRETVVCQCRKKLEEDLESRSTVEKDVDNEQEENLEKDRDDIILVEESDVEIEELSKFPNEISRNQCDLRHLITSSPDLFEDSEGFDESFSTPAQFPASQETSAHSSISTHIEPHSSNVSNDIIAGTTNGALKKSQQIPIHSEIMDEETAVHEESSKIPNIIQEKTRSNLTLFIEKVQRKQAKDILDSETEEDTPIKGVKLPRRNPFKVQKEDEDSFLCIKKRSEENTDQFIVEQEKKSALSLLEDRIRVGAGENMKNFRRALTNNVDIGELSTDDELDDLGESMYSKYRRTVSSNNSIAEHRKIVMEVMKKNPELIIPSSDQKPMEPKTSSEILDQQELDDINFDDSLDMEVQALNVESVSANRRHRNEDLEEIAEKNFSENVENKLESPIDLTHLSDLEYEHIQEDNPPPVLMDEYQTSFDNPRKPTAVKEHTSSRATMNIGDDLEFESWTDASKPAGALVNQSSCEKGQKNDFEAEKNSTEGELHQAIVHYDENPDVDQIFTQSLLSSQATRKRLERSKEFPAFSQESNPDRRNFTPSPISISSSSETSEIPENLCVNDFIPEVNKENSFIQKAPGGDLDINNDLSFPTSPWSTINEPGGRSTPTTSSNITFRPSAKILNESEEKQVPSTSQNITFRPSRVLKERTFSRYHSVSDNSGDEEPAAAFSTKSQSNLYSSIDKNDRKSLRFLASKSKSDTNFSKTLSRGSHIVDRSDSTPVSDRLTHLKKKDESIRISSNVSPCPYYSRMTSPELVKELQKYGLKKKTKRSNAVKLLENLYDRLHPIVPDIESNIDEEEPPRKKPCLSIRSDDANTEKVDINDSEDDQNPSEESNTSNLSIVPEEMELDDLPDSIQDKSSIKELFNKLCKDDRALHNKILTYAPLPLEDLHTKLKLGGFKGKVNDLMDFLDDECITFQVLDTNRNKDRRRKKNKAPQRAKDKFD